MGADLEEYQAIAVKLAGDRERRRQLRAGMRDRLRTCPLGQTEAFARDFYDMLAKAVADGPLQPAKGGNTRR